MGDNLDLPMMSFKTQKGWREWLEENSDKSKGIWLRFFKKRSGVKTVVYAEALDEALCFGWIDGQVKKLDEQSYVQRFTPRRKRSVWSKRNTEHVERLGKLGKMTASGWVQVEAAKADGRWEKAYSAPSEVEVPEDWVRALEGNTKAREFWEKLNKANRYAICWQLADAKKVETRERRLKKFVEMMERGEKLY